MCIYADPLPAATANPPVIATDKKLTGSSWAIMMIDLDIPTDNPPQTNTLLHWMQTGLGQSDTALGRREDGTAAKSFGGAKSKAAAPYFGPAPPARTPLTHRYTEILVDTSDATEADMKVLTDAAADRMGFDAEAVLTKANLIDKVVAGNFFTVSNPGPAQDPPSGGNRGNTTTGGAASGTGRGGPKQTGLPVVGEAWSNRASGVLTGIVLVAAVFVTL